VEWGVAASRRALRRIATVGRADLQERKTRPQAENLALLYVLSSGRPQSLPQPWGLLPCFWAEGGVPALCSTRGINAESLGSVEPAGCIL